MDGSLGPEAEAVLVMVEELKIYLDLEVVTWDERLSTVAAERVLLEADLSRKKTQISPGQSCRCVYPARIP